MCKKTFLNSKELTTVMINLISVKLFFTFPKKLVVNSGNAAWLQVIYCFIIVIGFFFVSKLAYKGCSNKNIVELSESVGGKALKLIVGLLVLFVLFLNLSSVIRSYPDMVKLVLLPDTPYEMIFLIYAVVIGIAAYVGMESIARIHAIFIPVVLFIMLVFFVLLLPHAKVRNLFPIFGNGGNALFFKGLGGLELFADILALNLILPNVKNTQTAEKVGIKALLVSFCAAFAVVFLYGTIYPYPASEKFIIPTYQLTRLVEIGDFFQRFESFFEFIWSIAVFLYSAFYLVLICRIFCELFDLQYEKPLIFPIMFIIVALSSGGMQISYAENALITIIICITSFVLPPLIAFIYKLKKHERNLP